MSDNDLGAPGALGGAFGGSAAAGAAALGGKLPPHTPRQTPRPTEQQQQADAEHARRRAEEEAVAARRAQAEQDRQEQEADPVPAGNTVTFQTSVYLLPAAVEAAGKVRRQRGQTNARIAFDAIDAVQHQLAALLAARRTVDQPPDSLFPARRTTSTREAAAAQGRRQLWSIQATDDELAVIDDLCAQHGATSRSELISTAVEAALTPRRRTRRR